MKKRMTALMCLCCVYASPSYALGDLLLSTQQRATIDNMRNGQSQAVTPTEQPIATANAMRVDGFFFNNHDKRENGTLWVNGKQVTDDQLQAGIRVKKINERSKTVSLQFDKTSASTALKAGQKLRLDDGEIQDAYQP